MKILKYSLVEQFADRLCWLPLVALDGMDEDMGLLSSLQHFILVAIGCLILLASAATTYVLWPTLLSLATALGGAAFYWLSSFFAEWWVRRRHNYDLFYKA